MQSVTQQKIMSRGVNLATSLSCGFTVGFG
jgi:hypothetical protein